MPRHPDFVPQGVIPAVLLPFHDDLSIDEASFRSHLRDVASVQGLSAITVNAHSTEVASCTLDEQRRVMEIAGEEVGGKLPVVHGVWADGSLEAARIARQAQAGGASALLVFPPAPFTLGSRPRWRWRISRPLRMRATCRSSSSSIRSRPGRAIPWRPWSGCSRKCRPSAPSRTGRRWCRSTRTRSARCRARKRPINVLSTNSAFLLSSLVLGCNGLLSGSGSVIADLQAKLFRAVKANDLAEARRLNDRIHPTVRVFYADPFIDMHNRMKEALVLLGKLPRAVVRPPLVKITRCGDRADPRRADRGGAARREGRARRGVAFTPRRASPSSADRRPSNSASLTKPSCSAASFSVRSLSIA